MNSRFIVARVGNFQNYLLTPL